jgi:polyhydroxybutyrate depolymerase
MLCPQAEPVVFAFHGFGMSPSDMPPMTGFNEVADTGGFLVVYPSGIDLSWNVGSCCGTDVENKVDEPAFVHQILADLRTIASIDPKRIYATGFSNGAALSYRLACEMSDTFAAIAAVSGVLLHSPCQPSQPVSVFHVHGLVDSIVPYAGGGDYIPGGFPPVEPGITTWVHLDGCNDSAQVDPPGTVPMTHTVYMACRAGTAVELYAIKYIGHSWPATYVLPVSQVIWDFFAAHPKP